MSGGTSCVTPSISDTLVFPVKRFWIRPQSTQNRDSSYSREPSDVSGTFEESQLRLLKSRGTSFASCNKKCTGFHNLPRNVLVCIFSHFLEREIGRVLAHVCRHWWLASHHPTLWRHLEFNGGCVPISVICRVLRRAPQLESVKFIAVPDVSTAIRQLCRCNVGVRSVSVKYCTGKEEHIPESVLRNLVVSCHKLCCLDLKGTQFYAQRFYQDLVNLAHLKSLNLGLNRFLKAQDLMLVAINCRGLEELRLSRRRTNSEQHTLTDPDASFLFHNMRYSLTSLKFDAQGLGAETFQAILSCSLLENLCLTNALFLTGDLFQSIPKKLPNLTKLKVTKACQLSTHDFTNMSNNKLEVLEVKRCSGRLAESLMNRLIFNCPLLRILAFKDSQFHSRSFFVLLHRLPLLTSINLGYNHYFVLEDLVCIANVCEQVSEIKILSSRMFFNRELSECNNIFTKMTDSGLSALSKLHGLKSLLVSKARHMTDSGLSALSKLHGLKSLLVSKARHVTSEGWKNLFDKGHFIDMESLLLTRNEGLDDICLFFVSTTCPRLRRLSLRSCMGVSDEGVEYLIHSCRRLVYLNIDGTHPSVGLSLLQIPRKNHPSSPDRDSNLDLPSLAVELNTTSALANYATEAGLIRKA
uniref:F-box domain-containing protein n=1 Tax=Timema cristinae TaxID=61476 RepID=A0A7R9CQI0_TIMCR|nr:unnamed protein product [Timema cristinae]